MKCMSVTDGKSLNMSKKMSRKNVAVPETQPGLTLNDFLLHQDCRWKP